MMMIIIASSSGSNNNMGGSNTKPGGRLRLLLSLQLASMMLITITSCTEQPATYSNDEISSLMQQLHQRYYHQEQQTEPLNYIHKQEYQSNDGKQQRTNKKNLMRTKSLSSPPKEEQQEPEIANNRTSPSRRLVIRHLESKNFMINQNLEETEGDQFEAITLQQTQLNSPAPPSSNATGSPLNSTSPLPLAQSADLHLSAAAAAEITSTNDTNSPVLELNAFQAAKLGLWRHSASASVILTIAYTMVFIVGIVGNSFVVAIVCKSPRMRTVTNYFIANLAFADILVLLFCLPANLIANLFVPYVLGLFVCKTVSYLQGVAVSASINTMVAVTMDRFLAICFPMDWHMSRRMARWTIACIWLFSSTISMPWAIYFTLAPVSYTEMTLHVCLEAWPTERIGRYYFVCANMILCYLLPATVIIFCYLGIWYKIERRNIPGDGPKGLKIELIMQKSKLKVVKMMMIVVVIFLLSWLPTYIIFARLKLAEDRPEWEEKLIQWIMPLAQWLGASNSCINPILYTFFNRKYKRGFIDLLRFGLCCGPSGANQGPRIGGTGGASGAAGMGAGAGTGNGNAGGAQVAIANALCASRHNRRGTRDGNGNGMAIKMDTFDSQGNSTTVHNMNTQSSISNSTTTANNRNYNYNRRRSANNKNLFNTNTNNPDDMDTTTNNNGAESTSMAAGSHVQEQQHQQCSQAAEPTQSTEVTESTQLPVGGGGGELGSIASQPQPQQQQRGREFSPPSLAPGSNSGVPATARDRKRKNRHECEGKPSRGRRTTTTPTQRHRRPSADVTDTPVGCELHHKHSGAPGSVATERQRRRRRLPLQPEEGEMTATGGRRTVLMGGDDWVASKGGGDGSFDGEAADSKPSRRRDGRHGERSRRKLAAGLELTRTEMAREGGDDEGGGGGHIIQAGGGGVGKSNRPIYNGGPTSLVAPGLGDSPVLPEPSAAPTRGSAAPDGDAAAETEVVRDRASESFAGGGEHPAKRRQHQESSARRAKEKRRAAAAATITANGRSLKSNSTANATRDTIVTPLAVGLTNGSTITGNGKSGSNNSIAGGQIDQANNNNNNNTTAAYGSSATGPAVGDQLSPPLASTLSELHQPEVDQISATEATGQRGQRRGSAGAARGQNYNDDNDGEFGDEDDREDEEEYGDDYDYDEEEDADADSDPEMGGSLSEDYGGGEGEEEYDDDDDDDDDDGNLLFGTTNNSPDDHDGCDNIKERNQRQHPPVSPQMTRRTSDNINNNSSLVRSLVTSGSSLVNVLIHKLNNSRSGETSWRQTVAGLELISGSGRTGKPDVASETQTRKWANGGSTTAAAATATADHRLAKGASVCQSCNIHDYNNNMGAKSHRGAGLMVDGDHRHHHHNHPGQRGISIDGINYNTIADNFQVLKSVQHPQVSRFIDSTASEEVGGHPNDQPTTNNQQDDRMQQPVPYCHTDSCSHSSGPTGTKWPPDINRRSGRHVVQPLKEALVPLNKQTGVLIHSNSISY